MKKKIRWYIFERIKRVNYVKTEINRLVGKSLFKNCNYNSKLSLIANRFVYYKKIKYNTISNFRLYGLLDLSPKLVNKKFRLSRFSLNKLAKIAKIPGFVKRGW